MRCPTLIRSQAAQHHGPLKPYKHDNLCDGRLYGSCNRRDVLLSRVFIVIALSTVIYNYGDDRGMGALRLGIVNLLEFMYGRLLLRTVTYSINEASHTNRARDQSIRGGVRVERGKEGAGSFRVSRQEIVSHFI